MSSKYIYICVYLHKLIKTLLVAIERYEEERTPPADETVTTAPVFGHSTSLAGHELEEQLVLLDQLLLLMSNVTKPCMKLVRQGGKLCRGKLDGDKYVCK